MSPRGGAPRPSVGFLLFLTTVLAAFAWLVLRPLLTPLVLAALTAVLFQPLHARIERRLGAGRKRAALASVTLLGLVCGLGAAALGVLLFSQGRVILADFVGMPSGATLTSRLAELVEQYLDWLSRLGSAYLPETLDLRAIADLRIQRLVEHFYDSLPDLLEALVRFLAALLIFGVALFFLLRDGRHLRELAVELSPLETAQTRRVLAGLQQTVRSVFLGSLLTALFQGVVGALGFFLSGFDNFAIWGVLVALAGFIPVVGTGIVWIPAMAYLAVSGHPGKAMTLLVFGLVISTFDNLIRLLVLGRHTTLHPLLLFLAVFGGLASGGAMGIVYGLLLASVLLEAVGIYRGFARPSRPAPDLGRGDDEQKAGVTTEEVV